jgi:hypothetical protein
MKKKQTIIFIVGAGRSGSTVLDKYLGGHSKGFSMGEIGMLDTCIDGMLCSCSNKMRECSFYKTIIENHRNEVLGTSFRIKRKTLFDTLLLRIQIFISIIFNVNLLDRKSKEILSNNHKIISSITKTSNQEVFIDSTKNTIRAMLLAKLYFKDYTIKYIYLIRHPFANIFSRKKKEVKVLINGKYLTLDSSTISQSCKMGLQVWNKQNLLAIFSLILVKKHVRVFMFEDFISNPKDMFNRLSDIHHLQYESTMNNLDHKEHHIVGGNYSKINAKEIIKDNRNYNEFFTNNEALLIKRKTKFVKFLLEKIYSIHYY